MLKYHSSQIKVLRHTVAALGYNEEISMPPDTDFHISILDGVWLPMCVAHWAMNGRGFWHYQSGFGWFPIACVLFAAQGAVWAVFLLQSLLHTEPRRCDQ
ncbi:hypothetical protein EXIGLDRAFT_178592 [Exidia glandulosa HHB12029]|uniref:Uncharacterized protein n=1 Tax=Exidia glandulosa HHB12029 TaxID=1314781 RepID=A0A165F3Y1_EXIGL|nr:hypothetical protein EXIGLDRAFT_178592 [Exidia glandulosa HHB12029]